MLKTRPLDAEELRRWRAYIGAQWPEGALVHEAIAWESTHGTHYKIWLRSPERPIDRLWILRMPCGDRVELCSRPATRDEIERCMAALREVAAEEFRQRRLPAEANTDEPGSAVWLSFEAPDEAVAGRAYRRWFVRFHDDDVPSVAYVLETPRGHGWKTLPGGRILRGQPW